MTMTQQRPEDLGDGACVASYDTGEILQLILHRGRGCVASFPSEQIQNLKK
jgi:hypothetical protein